MAKRILSKYKKRQRAVIAGDKLVLSNGQTVPIVSDNAQLSTALEQTTSGGESPSLPSPLNTSLPSTTPCSTTDLELLRERITALAVTGMSAKSISKRLNCHQTIVTNTIKQTRAQIEQMSADVVARLVSKLFVTLTVASNLVTSELIRRIIGNQLRIEQVEQGQLDPCVYYTPGSDPAGEAMARATTNSDESMHKRLAINALTSEIDQAIGRLGKFSSDLTGSLAAMGVPRLAKQQENGTQPLLSTTTQFYKSLGSKKEVLDELLEMNRRQGRKLAEMKRDRERGELSLSESEVVETTVLAPDLGDYGEK